VIQDATRGFAGLATGADLRLVDAISVIARARNHR
jgi:hypothetical protein